MANLSGSGAPSVNTVGTPGDIYTDTLTGTEYELNSIVTVTNDEETVTSYMWDRIFEFGGGGETGPQGPPGPAGADGEDGGYYTPSVSDTGDLTWTASEEGMAAIPSVNIKGPKGDKGDPGEGGDADTAITLKMQMIPEGSDLNDFVTPGFYGVVSNAIASTITNSPFSTSSFALEVRPNFYNVSIKGLVQIACRFNTDDIYTRYIYSNNLSEWSEWKKITTEKDLEGYLPLTGGTVSGSFAVTVPADKTFVFRRYVPDDGLSKSYSGAIYRFFPSTEAINVTGLSTAAFGHSYDAQGNPSHFYMNVSSSPTNVFTSPSLGLTVYENAIKWKAKNLVTEDALDDYALKSDITNVYIYKGSVASESNLPVTGQITGDVYNIETASSYGSAGMNVAWNGSAWDPLGGSFDTSTIDNTSIDEICV